MDCNNFQPVSVLANCDDVIWDRSGVKVLLKPIQFTIVMAHKILIVFMFVFLLNSCREKISLGRISTLDIS